MLGDYTLTDIDGLNDGNHRDIFSADASEQHVGLESLPAGN